MTYEQTMSAIDDVLDDEDDQDDGWEWGMDAAEWSPDLLVDVVEADPLAGWQEIGYTTERTPLRDPEPLWLSIEALWRQMSPPGFDSWRQRLFIEGYRPSSVDWGQPAVPTRVAVSAAIERARAIAERPGFIAEAMEWTPASPEHMEMTESVLEQIREAAGQSRPGVEPSWVIEDETHLWPSTDMHRFTEAIDRDVAEIARRTSTPLVYRED